MESEQKFIKQEQYCVFYTILFHSIDNCNDIMFFSAYRRHKALTYWYNNRLEQLSCFCDLPHTERFVVLRFSCCQTEIYK